MAIQQELGNKGEYIAAEFLENAGFLILERNFRAGKSEIDIICKRDNLLVFVEVKTRSSTAFGNPEDFVNEAKAGKITEGAECYIIDNSWDGAIRFDIISVNFTLSEPKVRHFKDAFY